MHTMTMHHLIQLKADTCMSIVGDVDVIYGVIEAYELEVRQRDLFDVQHVDVDRALMFACAFPVSLSPVRWSYW